MVAVLAPATRGDANRAARRLADRLGVALRLCGPGSTGQQPIRHWADRHGVTVAFGPAIEEAACHQLRFIGVPDPTRLDRITLETLTEAESVVCPTRSLHNVLRGAFPTSQYCPFDTGDPFVAGGRGPYGYPAILWDLTGDQAARTDTTAGSIISAVLEAEPRASLTTVVGSSALKRFGRVFELLADDFRERVVFTKTLTPALYDNHDLLFWPAVDTGWGLTGLAALTRGMPIAAYDAPAASEFLRESRNACLAQCELSRAMSGAMIAVPTPMTMAEATLSAISHLDGFKAKSHGGLIERRKAFEQFWSTLE